MIVIDASIAAKWYLEEEGSEAARSIARGQEVLAAPDLLLPEVANVLWRKVRLGQLSEAQLRAMASHLPGAFAQLVPSATLLGDSLELALQYDHPAYDCFYLALAVRLNATMVTADARMGRRFKSTPLGERMLILSA